MAASNFVFTPPTGLKDTNTFVDNPSNPRADIQGLLDQLKDYLNNTVLGYLVANSGTLATPKGQIKIPLGAMNFIIKWGTATTGTSSSSTGVYVAQTPAVTFDEAFPNACVWAHGLTSQTFTSWFSAATFSKTQLTIVLNSLGATDANNRTVNWIAVGY